MSSSSSLALSWEYVLVHFAGHGYGPRSTPMGSDVERCGLHGCRFVPQKISLETSKATDGVSSWDLNIGDSPGFGGLMKRAKSTA